MSARPGRVKEMVEIDLPRPRGEATRNDPKFTEYNKYLRGSSDEEKWKTSGCLKNDRGYALSVGVFIAIWWIYVAVKHVPAYILPSPPKVWNSLEKMFVKGTVYPHLWTTTYEVILGFVIGRFSGSYLDIYLSKVDALKTMLMPYLIFLQTAPKIALVPLFVIWFGIGLVSKVVLIISMVLFPVLSGMMLGLESIPPDVRNLMKILKGIKMADLFTG